MFKHTWLLGFPSYCKASLISEMLRMEMKIEGIVTTEEFMRENGATESSQLECCRGIPIMNLKELVWTIAH